MNRLLLFLIMLPERLYKRLGADPAQLRAILDVKLMMDDRKPVSFGGQQKFQRSQKEKKKKRFFRFFGKKQDPSETPKQRKDRRFSIFLGMFISFLTGFVYIFPLLLVEHRLSAYWLFFSMFLFLLAFTLISDFSTVLIDTRDKYIVLPRPVSDRTLFLSRVLHIFIYLFRIVLPMSLPAWVVLGFTDGWKAALFFPLPLLLLVFTVLFIVMAVYLIMLRVASAEKFKELLSYFQIAFSVIIFATYYLVPRAMDAEAMRHFNVAAFSWAPYSPPYWLAATFGWVHVVGGVKGISLIGLLAVALPVACIWITIKYLAPQFTARLAQLDAIESGETSAAQKRQSARKRSKIYQPLARLLNVRREAQAGFIMAWVQTSRSRAFKMRVYPMFAYVPIYFLYLLLQSGRPLREVWETLPERSTHLVLLYMCSVVMLQAFAFMSISEQYKAAWIYRAVPLAEPGAIFSGAFKVVWVKYFLPFFAAVTAFVLSVWGLSAISDVLLALVNVTLFGACVVRVSYRRFPFSQIDHSATGGSKFLRALIGMSIPFALGFGHYFALHMLWLKCIYLALSSILLWLVWDSYVHTGWDVIKAEDA
jgi:hypothetical protein